MLRTTSGNNTARACYKTTMVYQQLTYRLRDKETYESKIQIHSGTKTKGGNKTNDYTRLHQASPRTPSSHSSLETHPTALQLGQDTSTCSSILSSPPHPATRSALTKQAGWKVCEQTLVLITKLFGRARIDSCFIDEPETSGNGSSSDGPTPQLVSQHRKPISRSRSSTRLRRVGPGAGGGVHCFFSRGCDGGGAR